MVTVATLFKIVLYMLASSMFSNPPDLSFPYLHDSSGKFVTKKRADTKSWSLISAIHLSAAMHSNKAGSKSSPQFHFSTVISSNYMLLAKKEALHAQIFVAMVRY